MKFLFSFIAAIFLISQVSFSVEITELYKQNETPTYEQLIDYYKQLSETYDNARLIEYGQTDAGLPLQLFVITPDGVFDRDSIKAADKVVVMINNAIHAGEPCGVDASVKLADALLRSNKYALTNVVVCIIPAYNVGGMLNRSCCSRANQNGPKEYGFRGNAKNLDLNRDFIKSDAENTKQFYKIFHDWKPAFFIDAHSTNGADYPAELTLITSARSRLQEQIKHFFTTQVTFSLYNYMFGYKVKMSPYYHLFADSISQGLIEFMDTPRYSTGYTNLFNTMGFVTEAHMLKPYEVRVEATYDFIFSLLTFCQRYNNIINQTISLANNSPIPKEYGIKYELDSNTTLQVQFESFKRKDRVSSVTGLPIHYYDKDDRDTTMIPYYANYKPTKYIDVPKYYIVPQQWDEVIERLDLNEIKYQKFEKDTSILVETYYIENYSSVDRPYEGHYLHYNIETRKDTQIVDIHKGDLAIPTDQVGYRYLIETLEPEANDSFFAWNFFDVILQQKEWFSDYVFEPKAEKILAADAKLKAEFEKMKKENPEFAKNSWEMLYFIYKNSEYYEPNHNRYPIYRVPYQ